MSDKPKRTITDEQRKKMAEGRKKALEKRKLEKEQKRVDNEKDLKKELSALKQQKDQMEAKLITKENRKKFREKMRSKSVAFDEDVEEDKEPELVMDVREHSEEDKAELDQEEEDKAAHDGDQEEEPEKAELDRHERIFKQKVKEISGTASTPEAKTFFKKLTSNYDNKLDITTNLRNMSSELKELIAHNVEQIKTNNKVIAEAKAEDNRADVVEQPTPVEVRTEAKYQSQLASLMRLR
jgi:hypothetical protein